MAHIEAENGQGSILLQLMHDFCPLGLETMTSLLTVMVSGCYYLVFVASQNESQSRYHEWLRATQCK